MPLPEMDAGAARRDHRTMLIQLAIQAAGGVVLGVVFAVALIWFDIGGVGSRLVRASQPWLAAFVLIAPLALTFGAVVAGSSIMLMPYERRFREEREKEDDAGGR